MWSLVKLVLQPRGVLFRMTVIYFLSMLIIVLEQKENAFIINKWGFFKGLMIGPLLLLVTSVCILIGRLSTVTLAIAIAACLIYVTGYRGLVGISHAHDNAILSLESLRLCVQ